MKSFLAPLTLAWPVLLAGPGFPVGEAPPRAVIVESDFRDRVYACWLGKNIGGTLGMPVEGRRDMHNFTFYEPVPQTPAPNDDLDLALLWVKAVEEHGAEVDGRVLGGYWSKYVCVDWNEYGVGRSNLRDGFEAPLSGHIRNERWRDSNGAWIRSETWACLLPGCPALAARYAFEDASVDHGTAEGTIAELFTAALQSAAFVEGDLGRLLEIGLAYAPPGSGTARAVRAAREARAAGLELRAARERIVEVTVPTGWFMAPRNVGFVVLGLLYGDGDFGKTVCATVNCGDDTDSTGATAGATLGILLGTKGIPAEWRKPVGEEIKNVAISGFPPPKTIGEFTEQTVRMAKRMLRETGAPVEISARAPAGPPSGGLRLVDPEAAADLWARSPFRIPHELDGLRATVDYGAEPRIGAGASRSVKLVLENLRAEAVEVAVAWRPAGGLSVRPDRETVELPPAGEARACAATFSAVEIREKVLRGNIVISRGGRVLGAIPVAFLGTMTVSRDDLALARLGAKATSDSELDREPGCTPRAIDGEIEGEGDFAGKRWHSALTPHPHWVAVELPRARKVGRAIIHCADPKGYPVDFDGAASPDGKSWTVLFEVRGSKEDRRIEKAFPAVELKHFKLTIHRSANPQYPDAAQVCEIELLER